MSDAEFFQIVNESGAEAAKVAVSFIQGADPKNVKAQLTEIIEKLTVARDSLN